MGPYYDIAVADRLPRRATPPPQRPASRETPDRALPALGSAVLAVLVVAGLALG